MKLVGNILCPLHPRYSFYWDSLSIDEVLFLKEKLASCLQSSNNIYPILLANDPRLKDILERLGVVHSMKNESSSIEINDRDQIYSLQALLLESQPSSKGGAASTKSTSEGSMIPSSNFISRISGIGIMSKFASAIAVRVGRPEKSS